MKKVTYAELASMLSAYIDGELTPEETALLKKHLATNPELAQELVELQSLKRVIQKKTMVPESIGFWTRLSIRMEQQQSDSTSLFPFPRKYLPAVTAIGGIFLVLFITVAVMQYKPITDYLAKQSDQVQQVYEEQKASLQGSITQLFSKIDRNQVLQFAMFGTIPMDAQAGTILQVNEDEQKGYKIEVGKKQRPVNLVTVSDLYREIRATDLQKSKLDSLFDLGQQQIRTAFLMKDDSMMLVDPNITQLNQVMLAGISSYLEAEQRVRFEKYLEIKRAPFAFAASQKPHKGKDALIEMKKPRGRATFIGFTHDATFPELQFNVEELRQHLREVEADQREAIIAVESIKRRFATRPDVERTIYDAPVRVHVREDRASIVINLQGRWESPVPPELTTVARKRPDGPTRFQVRSPMPFGDPLMMMDSLLQNLDESKVLNLRVDGDDHGIRIFIGDSLIKEEVFTRPPTQLKGKTQYFPSGRKIYMDSLMNQINQKKARLINRHKEEQE
ncbi:MAG: zf-HC2 domain-containing protein [bacterium]